MYIYVCSLLKLSLLQQEVLGNVITLQFLLLLNSLLKKVHNAATFNLTRRSAEFRNVSLKLVDLQNQNKDS